MQNIFNLHRDDPVTLLNNCNRNSYRIFVLFIFMIVNWEIKNICSSKKTNHGIYLAKINIVEEIFLGNLKYF